MNTYMRVQKWIGVVTLILLLAVAGLGYLLETEWQEVVAAVVAILLVARGSALLAKAVCWSRYKARVYDRCVTAASQVLPLARSALAHAALQKMAEEYNGLLQYLEEGPAVEDLKFLNDRREEMRALCEACADRGFVGRDAMKDYLAGKGKLLSDEAVSSSAYERTVPRLSSERPRESGYYAGDSTYRGNRFR